MSERAAAAAHEAQKLQEEIAILKGLESSTGSGEIADAVKQRQDRIEGLASGATPRALGGPARPMSATALGALATRTLTQDQIHDIFDFYCNFGRSGAMSYQESLDNFMFMKFAKECPGLTDGALTRTEVDLIFVKAKPKFERRLDFEHFLDALGAISERKYPDHTPADGLRLLIANHLAPHWDIVQVEMKKTGETEIPLTGVFKKLYDVQNYTGVYAERFRSGDGRINGEADNRPGRNFRGSTNTATNEVIHDVSTLMRAGLHGGGTMMAPANHLLYKKDGTLRTKSPSHSSIHSPSRGASAASPRPHSAASTADFGSTSHSFLASPAPRGRSAAPTPASTPAGPSVAALGLDAATLNSALERARSGDASSLMEITMKLAEMVKQKQADGGEPASPAPGSSSGGASGAAAGEIAELENDIVHLQSELAEATRNTDDVDVDHVQELTRAIRARKERIGALKSGTASAGPAATPGRSPSRARTLVPSAGPAMTQDQIREIFEFYCNFGRSGAMTYQESLDNFMFMKFAKECPGLMDHRLTRTEVDLIFVKAKPKFERRLQFSHFLDALSAIAERKYPDQTPADGLRLLLANHLGPHWDIVQVEMQKTGETEIPLPGVFKKLYDVQSYTGVYAERFRSGDGRINGEADNRPGRQFLGSTNTATDEIIHDISVLMRPNLRSGTMMTNRPRTAGGSPRRTGRSSSPRRSGMTSPGGGDGRSVAGSVRSRGMY